MEKTPARATGTDTERWPGLAPGPLRRAPVSGPLTLTAVEPCRIMDTRSGTGFSGAFGPPTIAGNTVRSVPVPLSVCEIPSNAVAYSVNVTVVPPGPLQFLSLYPTGTTRPFVSTLNAFQGQIVANAAIVPAGANGSVDVYVSNTTDVVMDINGFFAPLGSAVDAFARYSGATSVGNSYVRFTPNTREYDPSSLVSPGTAWFFTPRAAGLYWVHLSYDLPAGSTSGSTSRIRFQRTGAEPSTVSVVTSRNPSESNIATLILNPGELVWFELLTDSATPQSIGGFVEFVYLGRLQ